MASSARMTMTMTTTTTQTNIHEKTNRYFIYIERCGTEMDGFAVNSEECGHSCEMFDGR